MGWNGTIAVGRRSEDLPMLCSTDSKVTVPPSTPSSKLFNLSLSSEPGSLLIILWLGVNMPLEPLRELDLPIGFRNSRQKRDRTPRLPRQNTHGSRRDSRTRSSSAFGFHVFLPSGFFSVPPPRSFNSPGCRGVRSAELARPASKTEVCHESH